MSTSRTHITSIGIVGFRGIRNGELRDLAPLSILVGPNGCGKSTVLEAIEIGTSDNAKHAVNQCVERRDNREIRWIVHGKESRALITCKGGTDYEGIVAIEIDRDNAGSDLRKIHRDVRPLAAGHQPIKPPQAVLVDTHVRHQSRPFHLQELYTEAVKQGRRNLAQALVCQVVSGATGIEILTEKNIPIINVVFDDHSVPLSLVGDAIQRVFRIALELASRSEGIVLLEEPEVFQHPGTLRQTARVILASVKRGIQVILSTHSLELIDAILDQASDEELDATCVYRLQLDRGELRTSRLTGADAKFSRQQIEDDLR